MCDNDSSNDAPVATGSAPVAPSEDSSSEQPDKQPDAESVAASWKIEGVETRAVNADKSAAAGMIKSSATQTDPIHPKAVDSADLPSQTQGGQKAALARSRSSHSGSLDANAFVGRPPLGARSRSDRLSISQGRRSAWTKFTDQHDEVLQKRIRGDEVRRNTRHIRQIYQTRAREFVERVRRSAPGEFLHHSEMLEQAFAELEEAEQQFDEAEDDLVQAESAISKTLPAVLGSDRDKTLEMLEREGLVLRPATSYDTISQQGVPLNEEDVSAEQSQLFSEHGKVDLIEAQLLNLREDKDLLRATNEAELDAESLARLRNFEFEDERLREDLENAKAQFERVRDTLQPPSPPLPASDDEDVYSE